MTFNFTAAATTATTTTENYWNDLFNVSLVPVQLANHWSSTAEKQLQQSLTMESDDQTHCNEDSLTDDFGWFIQGVLASLAFMLLIIKRFCEPKLYRRPWVIWFYDTSKQGIGSLVIHFANVFLAGLFTGDPCTWYIVSFLLDSSIGLCFIFVGIRASQWLAKRNNWGAFSFGEYGVPPRWQAWLGQCGVYILIMVVEKVIILLIIQLDFWNDVRDIILAPIQDPKLEVAIVVLVIPFVINALMFWVVDNFLMRKHHGAGGGMMSAGANGSRRIHYKKDDRKEQSESEVLLSGDDDSCELLMEVHGSGTHRHVQPNSSSSSALPVMQTTKQSGNDVTKEILQTVLYSAAQQKLN